MTSVAHNLANKSRTKDVLIEEQLNFNAFLLSDETSAGLHKAGFKIPSPIQLKAIPIGKCGFDLIIKSKSGTGKTAVFSIIALELINVMKTSLQVLILTPTREIAVQIQDVITSVGSEYKGLKVEAFIGGLPVDEDIKKIKSCHIAVGAPGRIKHLLQLGVLKTNKIKLLVLDEADKLINSEMKADIAYISNKLPANKQIISSSATYSKEITIYLEKIMTRPTLVEPDASSPLLLGLKQFVSVVKRNLNIVHQLNIKTEELLRLLSQIMFSQCLIFTNYQTRAESVSNILNRKGWNSLYISAAQEQADRLKVINKLKNGKCRILLSTDLTARGIDASNVDLVINYDVPTEASTYLHRMGRAGRYGSHGICITIAANGKELIEYQKILGTIGGSNMSVPQLRQDENLPSDLWGTDLTCFELLPGIIDESLKSCIKYSLASSLKNFKENLVYKEDQIGKENNSNVENNINVDSLNTDNIRAILQDSKDKEEKLKSTTSIVDTFDVLQKLAFDVEAEVPELPNQNSENMSSNVKSLLNNKKGEENLPYLVSGENSFLLDEDMVDTLKSKKRKRKTQVLSQETELPNNIIKNAQVENKHMHDEIVAKNVALLTATRLLCENFDTDFIAEDQTFALNAHLKTLKEENLEENISHFKKDKILNALISDKAENLSDKPVDYLYDRESILQNLEKDNEANLEDIFKISFDYAVNPENPYWLEVLGEELEEKMSLTEKVPEVGLPSSHSEFYNSPSDLPKRRRHRMNKKKYFKDFTQGNKKNYKKIDHDQGVDPYEYEIGNVHTNQMDSHYYYQAGLYSEHEYFNNQHFSSCFEHYSDQLEEKMQTFKDVTRFEEWFAQWQWQIQGIRDYVQQNIYLQEMNKYIYNKH